MPKRQAKRAESHPKSRVREEKDSFRISVSVSDWEGQGSVTEAVKKLKSAAVKNKKRKTDRGRSFSFCHKAKLYRFN